MRIKIYDSKQLEGKTWYLGSGNLFEYLSHLRSDFFLYKIQRRLVSNRYLDSIYQTIEQGEPIPPLTLISPLIINGLSPDDHVLFSSRIPGVTTERVSVG